MRHIGAPGSGTLRELLDWVSPWLQDPYDRSRPLWQYVVIDKLADGRGALAMKLQHVVTDGHGAVRLANAYTAKHPDQVDPPAVDLADALAADRTSEPPPNTLRDVISDLLRIPAGATRAVADALTHPERLTSARRQLDDLVRTAADTRLDAGSPLWTTRSRRRQLEAFHLPFESSHAAAKALRGTMNDLFVTGAVEAAARYHAQLGSAIDHLHISFVVSTRASSGTDGNPSQNSFTPVPVDVPISEVSLVERFAAVRELLRLRRDEVHGGGPMANVAVIANLLPPSMITGIVRGQAAHIDFATSNLPGYLGDSYVAGARTEHTYIFGPVAGTAFNLTAYSTAGSFDLGIQLDPAAVAQPALLRDCMESAYADLVAAGSSTRGAPQASTRKRRPRAAP